MTVPIRTMPELIHDWWRGWSDEDLASVLRKVADSSECGAVIPVTYRESKAYVAFCRAKPPLVMPQ